MRACALLRHPTARYSSSPAPYIWRAAKFCCCLRQPPPPPSWRLGSCAAVLSNHAGLAAITPGGPPPRGGPGCAARKGLLTRTYSRRATTRHDDEKTGRASGRGFGAQQLLCRRRAERTAVRPSALDMGRTTTLLAACAAALCAGADALRPAGAPKKMTLSAPTAHASVAVEAPLPQVRRAPKISIDLSATFSAQGSAFSAKVGAKGRCRAPVQVARAGGGAVRRAAARARRS